MAVSEVTSKFKTLLLSIGNSPEKEVEKRYADLDLTDRSIVRDFYVTQREGNSIKCGLARRRLIWRVGELANRLRNSSLSSEVKLKILARLINFHGILRENNITAEEVKSTIKYCDVQTNSRPPVSLKEMWDKPVEVTPSGLKEMAEKGDKTAKECSAFLSIEKERGCSYFQYLKDNIRSIILLPSQKAYFKVFPSIEWRGTMEELSRHVVSDTYSEKNNEPREIWDIISNLVHEAAHIEYYHDLAHAKDPASLKLVFYEAYAYSVQLGFLNNLIKAAGDPRSKMSFSEEQLRWVRKNIAFLGDKIRRRDFSITN